MTPTSRGLIPRQVQVIFMGLILALTEVEGRRSAIVAEDGRVVQLVDALGAVGLLHDPLNHRGKPVGID